MRTFTPLFVFLTNLSKHILANDFDVNIHLMILFVSLLFSSFYTEFLKNWKLTLETSCPAYPEQERFGCREALQKLWSPTTPSTFSPFVVQVH